MRLTRQQREIILSTLKHHFGEHSRILLFGSRVDDTARGGDIDLYIEPEIHAIDDLVEARLNTMVELHLALGDQKIDLVINHRNAKALPIYRIARETGVPL